MCRLTLRAAARLTPAASKCQLLLGPASGLSKTPRHDETSLTCPAVLQ